MRVEGRSAAPGAGEWGRPVLLGTIDSLVRMWVTVMPKRSGLVSLATLPQVSWVLTTEAKRELVCETPIPAGHETIKAPIGGPPAEPVCDSSILGATDALIVKRLRLPSNIARSQVANHTTATAPPSLQ